MPKKDQSKQDIEGLKEKMKEMTKFRLEMFQQNAAKYAQGLGAFRAALKKSGFSEEESMQIILKLAERPPVRPFFFRGMWGRRRKD